MILGLMTTTVFANEDAIKLVKNQKSAIGATIYEGYPYNSVMPYVLDENGFPIVLLSDLALHTENIKDNPKASFIITQGDPFSGSRLTLLGEFVVIPEEECKAVREAYIAAHKDAEEWVDFGDFNFYKLDVKKVYWVGGFGSEAYIGWLDIDKYKKGFKK